jgi:hypothetical protein
MIFIAPLSFILVSITTFIPAASSLPQPIEARGNGLESVILPTWATEETTATRPWFFEDTLGKRGVVTLPADATKATATKATATHITTITSRFSF